MIRRRNIIRLAVLLPSFGNNSVRRALTFTHGFSGTQQQTCHRCSTVRYSLPDPFLSAIFARVRRTLGDRPIGNEFTRRNDENVNDLLTRVEDGATAKSKKGTTTTPSNDVLDATILERATTTIETREKTDPSIITASDDESSTAEEEIPYNEHPAITATALAHSLWQSVVRPGNDTIIDATAGNGHDTKRLAELLYSSSLPSSNAQLIAIDIQPKACQATKDALATLHLPASAAVQVLCQSHETLPSTNNNTPLGLVVYNLGYLPGNITKSIQTETSSTLASLQEASARLRVGGMVSIVTYPRSNPDEAVAVASFAWPRNFRVFEHKALGSHRADSPILYTALRIK